MADRIYRVPEDAVEVTRALAVQDRLLRYVQTLEAQYRAGNRGWQRANTIKDLKEILMADSDG